MVLYIKIDNGSNNIRGGISSIMGNRKITANNYKILEYKYPELELLKDKFQIKNGSTGEILFNMGNYLNAASEKPNFNEENGHSPADRRSCDYKKNVKIVSDEIFKEIQQGLTLKCILLPNVYIPRFTLFYRSRVVCVSERTLTTIDNKYIECQKRNYASFGGKSIFF